MKYGQCEIYGVKKFNFFSIIKNITQTKKGFIEVHKEVSLSLDNHEEEI